MSWFYKKKEYPDYWNSYSKHFDKKKLKNLDNPRFVALDTETTGFDFNKDRLLCIGAVSIVKNQISVNDSFERYIKQARFNPDSVKIHGIIHNTKIQTVSEESAVIQFLDYIKDSILVAHHAIFDITMINEALFRLGLPKLKNKVIDTVDLYAKTRIKSNIINTSKGNTLDDIAEAYSLDLSDRHTASGDALIAALIFIKTTNILKKSNSFKLKKYFIKRNRF